MSESGSGDPNGGSRGGTSAARLPLWLLPPFALGAALRFWHLGRQVIGGDELHAVRAALRLPVSSLLVTFLPADPCIPLSALYRVLLDCGVPLSEPLLRLPVVLASLLLLAAGPLLLRGRLGERGAMAFAWLLAISPEAVLYGRIVRSYAPLALLTFLAALAFDSWWRAGRRRAAFGFVTAGALAVWFHLVAAPFIAAPFVFALIDLATGPREMRGKRLRALAALAVGLAAALAVLLGPGLPSLLALARQKSAALAVSPETFTGAALLLAGTRYPAAALLFGLLVVTGAVALLRADRRFGLYVLVLIGAQVAGVLVLSPVKLEIPLVFARYLTPALPWLLVLAARALGGPPGLAPSASRIARLALAGLPPAAALALLAAGPLARAEFLATCFAHHVDRMSFEVEPMTLPAIAVPEIYRRLASDPRPGDILEAPGHVRWILRIPYLAEPSHGRREVLWTVDDRALASQRLRLRTLVPENPDRILASRARFLVVHLDLPREEDRVEPPEGRPKRSLPRVLQVELRRRAHRLTERLEELWGPPDGSSGGLLLWDLDRVRGGHRHPADSAEAVGLATSG